MRYLLALIFGLFIAASIGVGNLHAQSIRLSLQPDSFIVDLGNYLKPNRTALNTPIVDSFSTTWSNYDAANQKRFITIARFMAGRRMAPNTFKTLLLSQISANSKGLNNEQTGRLLFATWRVMLQQPAKYQTFLNRVNNYCAQNSFEYNKKYKVLVESPSFSIDYIGGNGQADTGAFSGMVPYQVPSSSGETASTEPETDGVNAVPDAASLVDIDGPVIKLTDASIIIITAYDSTSLRNTSGYYLLDKGIWRGKGGKIDWSQAGLEPDEVNVSLGEYQWKTINPGFTCDRATCFYPKITPKKIVGFFEWGTNRHAEPAGAQYPKFSSYLGDFKWQNFSSDIKIKGGITLSGKNQFVENYYKTKGYFSVLNEGKTAFISSSTSYTLADSVLRSNFAKLSIYNNKDSITHQGLVLAYYINTRQLWTETENALFKETPFLDSYHKVEITCDEARFLLDSNQVQFRIAHAGNLVPAVFQSYSYFNAEVIAGIRAFNTFDPLVLILAYQKLKGVDVFTVDDVVAQYKLPPNDVERTVRTLAGLNFINYDPAFRRLTILPKLTHYYYSRLKKTDFDYISMPSFAGSGLNAVFNVKNNDMRIVGVKKFFLSDSLGVYIEPYEGDVTMKKNRNLVFNGKINAGAFLTAGKQFEFDYEKFLVKLTEIDSISLNVNNENRSDSARNSDMISNLKKNLNKNIKLEHNRHTDTTKRTTTGTLYINRPDNKAGLKKYKQYPILDVSDKAYVYFDREAVGGKIYDEKVRFDVPPFQVDSANTTDPKVLNFLGTFHSDDIFPAFKEKLAVQSDKSLGFKHKTPGDGYQLYKGKGKFLGTITLNNKGIRGKGEIKYLGATIKSNNFKFYQDSVVADGKAFVLTPGTRENVSFPEVKASAWHMKWLPKVDSMVITSRKSDIRLYESSTQLEGDLILQTTGVAGKGVLKREGVEITSNQLSFKEKEFSGHEAKFIVLSNDSLKPSVRSTNVKFEFNLQTKLAEINPEIEGEAANEFPMLNYKTSIAKMIWDSQKKIITMDKPEAADISSSYFYSTAKDQDSLVFTGTSAIYDIDKKILDVKGVPFITVSDANIYPDSGMLTIEEGAKMQKLKNAKVILDTLNQYHSLDSAFIDVNGRYSFNGTANYRYPSPNGDTLKIRFTEFKQNYPRNKKGDLVKRKGVTEGIGVVTEERPIPLASGIIFKGNVKMVGSKQHLEFDGFVSLSTKMSVSKTWIPYKNLDNAPFQVELKNAVDASNGRPIVNGLILPTVAAPGVSVYNNFVASKRDVNDIELFTSNGDLTYDADTRLFKIGPKARVAGKTIAGNIMTYSDTNNTVNYDGKFTLVQLGRVKQFQVNTAGVANGRTDSNNINMTVMQQYKMDLPSGAMKSMELATAAFVKDAGLPEASIDEKSVLISKIANMTSESSAKSYETQTKNGYQSICKLVPQLANGLMFTNVDMKWDRQSQSFYSVGKLGLGNINKQELNVGVNGAIEIKKSNLGDIVSIYLEFGPDLWYYFNLNETLRMTAVSNDDAFNMVMSAKNQVPNIGYYSHGPADVTDKVNFLTDYFKRYLGQEYKEGKPWPGSEAASSDDGFPSSNETPVTDKKETSSDDSKLTKKEKKAKKLKEAAELNNAAANDSTKSGQIDEIKTDNAEPEKVAEKPVKKSKKQLKAEASAAKELEKKLQAQEDSINAANVNQTPSTDPFGNVSEEKQVAKDSTLAKPIQDDIPQVADSTAIKAKMAKEEEKRLKKEAEVKAKADKEAAKAADKAAKEEAKRLKDAEKTQPLDTARTNTIPANTPETIDSTAIKAKIAKEEEKRLKKEADDKAKADKEAAKAAEKAANEEAKRLKEAEKTQLLDSAKTNTIPANTPETIDSTAIKAKLAKEEEKRLKKEADDKAKADKEATKVLEKAAKEEEKRLKKEAEDKVKAEKEAAKAAEKAAKAAEKEAKKLEEEEAKKAKEAEKNAPAAPADTTNKSGF